MEAGYKNRKILVSKIENEIFALKKSIEEKEDYKLLEKNERIFNKCIVDNKEINEHENKRIEDEKNKIQSVLSQSLKEINNAYLQMKVDEAFKAKYKIFDKAKEMYNSLFRDVVMQCKHESEKERQRYDDLECTLKFAFEHHHKICREKFEAWTDNAEEEFEKICSDVDELQTEMNYIFDSLPEHMAYELEQNLSKDTLDVVYEWQQELAKADSVEEFNDIFDSLEREVSKVGEELTQEYDIVFLEDYDPGNYPDPDGVDEEDMGIDDEYYEALGAPGED